MRRLLQDELLIVQRYNVVWLLLLPLKWMLLPLLRYNDFWGRSRRLEFWMFIPVNVVSIIVQMRIVDAVEKIKTPSMTAVGMAIFAALLSIAMIIPFLAVTVRRLHDQNRSGWWILLMVIPVFLPDHSEGWYFVGVLLNLMLLLFMCRRGTKGPNRFDSDPLEYDIFGVRYAKR